MKMASLIKAIGPDQLTEYFQFLDDLRETGSTNMFGAAPYLQRTYRGMTREEAHTVLVAWQDTFSNTLPPEDRADAAIEKAA
jgi:hypothetical protein